MEYPIAYRGERVGTLTVTEDGLYRQLSGWTETFADGVQRLFACFPQSSVPLGVLAPSGKGLSLHRRLSRHALPALPERWAAGRASGDFLPWQGTVEGQEITDALLKTGPEETLLAIPADRDPLPLAEYLPRMHLRDLDGRAYLCLPLRDGQPELPPDEEAEAEPAPDKAPAPEREALPEEATVPRQEPAPIPAPGPGFYPAPDLPPREKKPGPQIESTSSTGQ